MSGLILGVDPGLTGAIAFYAPSEPQQILVEDMPVAGGEVDIDTLVDRLQAMRPSVAFIERVSAMPKQGVASTFKFGMGYGAVRAAVLSMRIPYALVTPGKWKAHYRLSADKEMSRELALRTWPGCGLFARKKDSGRAEAALIALYGAKVATMPLQEAAE